MKGSTAKKKGCGTAFEGRDARSSIPFGTGYAPTIPRFRVTLAQKRARRTHDGLFKLPLSMNLSSSERIVFLKEGLASARGGPSVKRCQTGWVWCRAWRPCAPVPGPSPPEQRVHGNIWSGRPSSEAVSWNDCRAISGVPGCRL